MNENLRLRTAVWIYDIDRNRFAWANESALGWWQACSVDELNQRNFQANTSDAVKQRLLDYQNRFRSGEVFCELWQFFPNGETKQAFCQFSGILIDSKGADERMGMLVEAIPFDRISPFVESESSAILASFDEQGQLLSCNPPFTSEFGESIANLQSLAASTREFHSIYNELEYSERVEKDLQLNTLKGTIWFHAVITAGKQNNGKASVLLHLYNIDALKHKEMKLMSQARTDMLTGLLNRRGLRQVLSPFVEAQTSFHLFYIDLDGFKMINDSLGHSEGDFILQEVADRLRGIKSFDPKVCRFGGDEFVLAVCAPITSEQAEQVASHIIETVSQPFTGKQSKLLVISASVGYSSFPAHSDKLDDIIRYADSAMYYSKKLGKKRYTEYKSGMEKDILRKSLVAQHLTQAIENDELTLFYQPIMDVQNNTIYCFEALLRWTHPELGMVNPQELISIAEDIGLIEDVENWVINTACRDLKALRDRSNSNARIAVNISALHLVAPEFPEYLMQSLKNHSLAPQDMIIELTESVLLDDVQKNNEIIDTISDYGIGISIDDFGTGYSSLAYLHNFKASIVKIDKAFVSKQSSSKTTLLAIKQLISSMHMVALIEGVETEEKAQMCSQIGINLQQGFYYARPKPLSDL